MSTLTEIAANHAKMAKAREQELTCQSEQPPQPQIVGSIEVAVMDGQHMPLHLIGSVQDNNLGQTNGCVL